MKTTDALKLTSRILDAVVEAVTACGKDGAPAAAVFVGLEAQGCTMEQFAQVVSTLVQAGRIRRDGDTLLAVKTVEAAAEDARLRCMEVIDEETAEMSPEVKKAFYATLLATLKVEAES